VSVARDEFGREIEDDKFVTVEFPRAPSKCKNPLCHDGLLHGEIDDECPTCHDDPTPSGCHWCGAPDHQFCKCGKIAVND
jgi:hypothetical protein